jgi:hypothetical protein
MDGDGDSSAAALRRAASDGDLYALSHLLSNYEVKD